MDGQIQSVTPPVPTDKHYLILKDAEESIKSQLGDFEHYLLLCGLSIGYTPDADAEDSPKFPYSMDFGYLESLDCAMENEIDEISESDWQEQTKGTLARHPLPIEYLDKLYAQTKSSLEAASGTPLVIGVKIVLYGSPLMGYSIGCLCGKRGRRRKRYCYYDKRRHRTKCYCTRVGC